METNNAYQSFTELTVWQEARKLKNDIAELVKCFPSEEKYRLTDQLIRSSRSIGSNIAEGHGRFSYKEQLHFCIQARGSLSETRNHFIDAFDCNYINVDTLKEIESKIENVAKILNGYITFLRNSIKK